MHVTSVTESSPELLEACARLLPQLSSRLTGVSPEALAEVLRSESVVLFVARHEDRIVGLLTLVCYRVVSGAKAWIEDVVVDATCRRCGAGRALVAAALERAKAEGIERVMLTSSAARVAAHALYRQAGFVEAETSVFVYKN